MTKWKLMLTTLPYVLIVLGLKLGLQYGLGVPGYVDFADVGLVLTAGVFLLGFMLAGTMADYKESEKLPGEAASALECIEETLVQATVIKPDLDAGALMKGHAAVTSSIADWFHGSARNPEPAMAAMAQEAAVIRQVEKAGAGVLATQALRELASLRRALVRVTTISRTGFLETGYALLEVLTAIILGLLLISNFKNTVAEIILVSFVTLVYVYMLRLIRDIDDPFEYTPNGSKGAAEVDLSPILEYRTRLLSREAARAPAATTGAATVPASSATRSESYSASNAGAPAPGQTARAAC